MNKIPDQVFESPPLQVCERLLEMVDGQYDMSADQRKQLYQLLDTQDRQVALAALKACKEWTPRNVAVDGQWALLHMCMDRFKQDAEVVAFCVALFHATTFRLSVSEDHCAVLVAVLNMHALEAVNAALSLVEHLYLPERNIKYLRAGILQALVACANDTRGNLDLSAREKAATLISHLSVGGAEVEDLFIETGSVAMCHEQLANPASDVMLEECLVVIRNLTVGPDRIKAKVCSGDTISTIVKLLEHPSDAIKEHAAGALRNFGTNGANSNKRKGQMVAQGATQVLVRMLKQDISVAAKVQAAYALWNISNSIVGAEVLIQNDLVSDILAVYDKEEFDDRQPDSLKSRLVGVLCCLSANVSDVDAPRLLDTDIHTRLHQLMMTKNPVCQPVNAACGLANLIGGMENHPMLNADDTMFTMMVDCLKATRDNLPFHGAFFSEWGLIRNLANMSVSDVNKGVLKRIKALETVCSNYIPKINQSQYVDLYTAKLISNMSFSYDLKKDFSFDIAEVVSRMEATPFDDVKAHVLVAKFQQKLREEGLDVSDLSASHILYLTTDETFGKSICDIHNGEPGTCKCLVVTDNSIMTSAAKDVKGAKVVFVEISSKIKHCPAARSLAEFADKLRKPLCGIQVQEDYEADGWLDVVLTDRPTYDATDDGSFMSSVKDIQQQMESPTPSHRPAVEDDSATQGLNVQVGDASTAAVSTATITSLVTSTVQQFVTHVQELQGSLDAKFSNLESKIDNISSRLSRLEGTVDTSIKVLFQPEDQ
eukprot:m.64253 g.64253  ORF g.64253 m.64253 type:complete len:769 (-) comp11998_c1_seq1:68-2374(-)